MLGSVCGLRNRIRVTQKELIRPDPDPQHWFRQRLDVKYILLKVKNLDTGTEMDLATAEEQLPQSINPLSLHIMRLTSEYTGSDTILATQY